MERRGDKKRGLFSSFKYLPPSSMHTLTHTLHSITPHLPRYLNPHTKTEGWMKDMHTSLSVSFFFSSSLTISLSLSTCPHFFLSHTHTLSPLCVFLIKSAVNQIMPLCNKLQTWEWRRDRDGG